MTNTVELVFSNKQELLEKGIEVDEQHIIDLLKQVVEAITNGDFVLVADLLNYEIKEIFEQYIQKI
jgi:fructose-1-phosphate kinase PfkB-like protein